jgi:2-keto-3-deoxy-galactonokinase
LILVVFRAVADDAADELVAGAAAFADGLPEVPELPQPAAIRAMAASPVAAGNA